MARRVHWTIKSGITLEYYQLEHDVFPKIGSPEPTDVMLVQFLIQMYFATPYVALQIEFLKLFSSATSRGARWDDGIYGPNTREGVRLFELSCNAPYKDGIVRSTADAGVHPFNNYLTLSKLGKLNWVFDRALSSDIEDKQHIIKQVASPRLSAKLLAPLDDDADVDDNAVV